MNIAALQQLAIQNGLNEYGNKTSEKVLIRAIQKKREEEPCFSTDKRYLCNADCEWRTSCQKLRAIWLR